MLIVAGVRQLTTGSGEVMKVVEEQGATRVVAYRGDARTLLAFDLTTEASHADLAGFTVQITSPGHDPYYLQNNLRFAQPGDHTQDPK